MKLLKSGKMTPTPAEMSMENIEQIQKDKLRLTDKSIFKMERIDSYNLLSPAQLSPVREEAMISPKSNENLMHNS